MKHNQFLPIFILLFLCSFCQQYASSFHKRHNFASSDTGARVIAASSDIISSTRILNEDPDKYCLIPQKVKKKWITIQLSEEILMDTFAIANFEHYACSFKVFQLLGTTQYPCVAPHCHWTILGTFFGEDSKKLQEFKLEKPFLTRFLKILFVSHYHEELYYCTVSVVKVHGSTLLEDLKFNLQNKTAQKIQDTPPSDTIPLSHLHQTTISSEAALEPVFSKHQVNISFGDPPVYEQITNLSQAFLVNGATTPNSPTQQESTAPSLQYSTPKTCKWIPYYHYFRIDSTCSNRNYTLIQPKHSSTDHTTTITPSLFNLNIKALLPGLDTSVPQAKNQNILVFLLRLIQQQENHQQIIVKNMESMNSAFLSSLEGVQKHVNQNAAEHDKLKDAIDTLHQKLAHLEQELHSKSLFIDRLNTKLDHLSQNFKADVSNLEHKLWFLIIAMAILFIISIMLIVTVVRNHMVKEAKYKDKERTRSIGGSEENSPQDFPIVGSLRKQPPKKKTNSFLKKGGFLPQAK